MISSSSIEIADSETLSKLEIRQKVWKHFQENELANFPIAVFRRIPNFKGAEEAAERLVELDCFKNANSVKVNLDKPQGEVRFRTLQAGKVLLVPTPGLHSGLFNRMDSMSAGESSEEKLRLLAQNDGMKRYSQSLQLDEAIKVDLIVVGSVAVSKSGHRIGKGEGFVDLEYGMMRHINCVSDDTLIVTTVHDCQVFDDLPPRLFGPHDVPVDVIVTPTQVINVPRVHKRPPGILWNLISTEKFYRVAILHTLYQRLKDSGEAVKLATDEPVPSADQIAEYWKNIEAEREANREARAAERRRGGPRGRRGGVGGFRRGRGGRRYGRPPVEAEEGTYDEDGNRIQVTLNVNKRNRIVRRSVRSSGQEGEQGEEMDEQEPSPRGGRGRTRFRGRRYRGYYGGRPAFSIFLGNVPSHSRTREIKEAVKNKLHEKIKDVELLKNSQAVDIQRRTVAGYAFMRFGRLGREHADQTAEDLVDALQGLKILDQEVVVERARDRPSRGSGAEDGAEITENGGDDMDGGPSYGRYRGGRGARRGGKRYRGPRRGRGGYGGGEDRRRRIRDEDDGEYEEEAEHVETK